MVQTIFFSSLFVFAFGFSSPVFHVAHEGVIWFVFGEPNRERFRLRHLNGAKEEHTPKGCEITPHHKEFERDGAWARAGGGQAAVEGRE